MRKRITKADNPPKPGRLRIVAGKWRSRLLQIAAVPGLRPTSERIRETLFNWLAPYTEGARCLDLFAGSGALGFEALSRGAERCVFVEKSAVAVASLNHSLVALGAENAEVRHADASEFIAEEHGEPFDIVFLDPPFAAESLDDLCRLLAGSSKLAPGARIYLEEDRHSEPVELPDGWQLAKTKSAGNVRYSLVNLAMKG